MTGRGEESVLQGGRRKAYRPLAPDRRRASLAAGLEAYERGDAFLAHELLEPAWMGTADLAERELLQGLIKLAAAFVHAARSNPAGVAKNLRGARDHLIEARRGDAGAHAPDGSLDVEALVTEIDRRLAAAIDVNAPPIPLPRRVGSGD